MKPKTKPTTTLILGGYGTFGSRIAKALCAKGHHVIVNGRNEHKAQSLQQQLLTEQSDALISVACFDVFTELKPQLIQLKPDLVIHTCGPFQGQDTQVAKTIIEAGIDYIDLSDGRDYVLSMLQLNRLAKANGVTAITAASTVPTLSSAALMYLQQRYKIVRFKQVKIGISPGQKTARGLATVQAVLSYIGKPLKPWRGLKKNKYGWQDTYLQSYPNINNRLVSNCEAPDLDCLPDHFPIDQLFFSAGMESKLLHVLIIWSSWLIRLGLPLKPDQHAEKLMKISNWFNPLGSEDGGMHVAIQAVNDEGLEVNKTWFIEAKNNHGPQIPAIPAIILADKMGLNKRPHGVFTATNTVSLEEYLCELKCFDIQTLVR